MKNKEKIIYCADAIVIHMGMIVVIERLGSVKGLALPGGKQESEEVLTKTIKREIMEETNLDFSYHAVLGTYAEEGRDPRGRYVSTVFIGFSTGGVIKGEPGKTNVLLMDPNTFPYLKDKFIFDHGKIIEDYLAQRDQRV
jgi:ADP-ribose pyrophosphatase YjhB (NUDIX family)